MVMHSQAEQFRKKFRNTLSVLCFTAVLVQSALNIYSQKKFIIFN